VRPGFATERVDTNAFAVGRLVNGRRQGTWEAFAHDTLLWRCDYADGGMQGVCLKYDVCGFVIEQAHWAHDALHGVTERWYDNGLPEARMGFANGQLEGAYETWHRNGALSARGVYSSGRREGHFEEFWDNGVRSFEATYSAGEVAGLERRWDAWGRATFERGGASGKVEYRADGSKFSEKVNGVTTTYFDDGAKQTQSDQNTGIKRAWYRNGQLMLRVQPGPDGTLLVEHWEEDGTPISAEEYARREKVFNERLSAVLKVLEVPLTVVISGLK
jgi:antitoxin component YwqK of YwqJK toxin-antitoxin module